MEIDKEYSMFAQRLQEFRKAKGYTQRQLAEIAGVSQRVIDHYEKYPKRPSIDKIKKLAEALGVTDEELLGTAKVKNIKQDDISFKIMKKVRIIEKLPTRDQNAVFHFINSLAQKNRIK